MKKRYAISGVVGVAGLALATPAVAQTEEMQQATASQLMSMDVSSLRGEIDSRYDAALATSNDPAIVAANDPRYIWASEAKVQCGIAHGYLERSIKDETSISKCNDFYNRMLVPPAPPVVQAPPPPPVAQQVCEDIPGIVFFDFDSATVPSSAMSTLDTVVSNAAACNWTGLTVAGHTDRSGSTAYNQGLSERRAEAVAAILAGRGIARTSMDIVAEGESNPRVPTDDGVREAQNRRVEITHD